jgi:RNA polymerase sigma-70 factor (ECF subfamily)
LRKASLERGGDRPAASAAVLAEIEAKAVGDGLAEHLVRRAHAGDEFAFAELYVHYFRRVHRYLSIALKNPEDAQEATQDVFVKVFRGLHRYEQRTEPFANWLFRVVRNHALDFQKREWRTEAVDPHELARRDRGEQRAPRDPGIGSLIDKLPDAQRRVLVLRYVYDFTIADIANALGKSADSIRHVHMRALRAVGTRLPEAERKQHEERAARR